MIVPAVMLGAVVLWAVTIYNSLIAKHVATENAWSQIDVQLKRRHDLIPNLVEVVKGYASHEKETLENVIKARQQAVDIPSGEIAATASAENFLTGALRQLFALQENYPELKANQNFSELSEEIASTENKISFARQHYNDTTAIYNMAIQQIPNNLVAGMANFPKRDFFELDASEAKVVQQAPQVSFS